ncbi:BTAD domain-containing putative transcriptional regulator [Dactylosporangium sp. NPDC048998]|uniref:BTAD domain-containing putative transcriptional regulator n=1 Tax=Dactylosporangium sp. NPDC048998 TaxID=3363976 RepID=UPI0037198DE5
MADDVVFRLLGPVEVHVPGRPAAALPPSLRPLLARLVLAAGRVVPVDTLTDALWGEQLPADATNALQTRISKLRRALGPAGELLVTRAPGYQLAVAPEAADVQRFEQAVGRARAARDAGAAADAIRGYDEALRWWRGPALADAGDAEWAERERHRLEQLRLGAVEDRLELLLETGRHADAVADLERLVAEHPLRERLSRLLMLALYGSGRQAEALTVHRALRERLADELGIDPAPDVQALAEAILRQQVPAAAAPAPVEAPAPSPAAATPPPAVMPAPAGTSLPARLTSLVGRQDDLATVLDQLRAARVVTLTGPGGVGKTTLALEAARRVDARIAGTVRFVRLAALAVGADVAEEVAVQLGLTAAGPGAAGDAAAAHLAGTRTLLLLDNCEHVVDGAATLVEHLVRSCPDLRVLATSREALAVTGEVQLAVAPLAVPIGAADPAATPAVQLFLDRARAVRPGFELDAGTAPAVVTICRQLDGMPLAIELAAARVKALPPAEIAARLHDRFTLLSGGPRTAEARHRTLRAALDWSHDLLPEPERVLLRRLAVFRGGWDLAAAEDVCGFAGLAPGDVLDLLFRLVDRSLVVPDPHTGRFRLLATIQEYAVERLAEAVETDACRDRHLEHYTRLAEEHGSRVRGDGTAWARLLEDADNLRDAVDRALHRAPRDPASAQRLTAALIWYWNYGLRHEGDRALTALLDSGGADAHTRAQALRSIGLLNVYYPTPRSRAAARDGLALFEALGDTSNAAMSRLVVAWEGQYGGDAEECRGLVRRGRSELGDADNGWWLAVAEYLEALLDLRTGAFDDSARRWRHAETLFDLAGDAMLGGAAVAHLGVALREAGQLTDALDVLHRAAAAARRSNSPHGLAFSLVQLAHARLDAGDGDVAALLDEADAIARHARNPRCQAWAAWGRARIALAHADAGTAGRECHRAVTLLEDREFPWALTRLRACAAAAD